MHCFLCCILSPICHTIFCAGHCVHVDDGNLIVQQQRAALLRKVRKMTSIVLEHLPLDSAADQIAAGYMQHRLPLAVMPPVVHVECLTYTTRVRLFQRNCARLVVEDDKACIYHCKKNSRAEHAKSGAEGAGRPAGRLEFDISTAEMLEVLLKVPCMPAHAVTLCDIACTPGDEAGLLRLAGATACDWQFSGGGMLGYATYVLFD